MKTILQLISLFIVSLVYSQTVLIPNGGFDNNLNGWSVSGTDTSISNSGGFLSIDVSGIYTWDFILTSPQFNLESNKTYKLYGDVRHVYMDPNTMEESPLGSFSDILLKDLGGSTVANVSFSNSQSGYFDINWSSNFTVPSNGTYYLEFKDQHSSIDTEYLLDNVGFEEIIINTFSGKVTLDVNNDSCATSTTTVANFPIQLSETNSNTNYHFFTDVNGDYNIETHNITGNFVTQTNLPLYNATPSSYTNVITSNINNITNQDFCIIANTTANDVSVSIIPTTQARPGFNTSYQVRYTNYGTTTLNGSVTLNFDNTKVSYLSASTVPSNTTSNTLSWNYTNLSPLETRYVNVDFSIFTPPTVNNGDILTYLTSITPTSGDVTPTNNIFTFNQTTVGSYDPNDIRFLEGALISSSQAADYLNCIIRFQNEGTASAINITVKNTLDAFLD